MASSFTPSLSLEEPANGDYVNDWNLPNNSNFTILDLARGGNITLNAGNLSGTVALTTGQYQTNSILITGTPSANLTYQLPGNVGGSWSVLNSAGGNSTITFASAGGGRTTTLAQGYRTEIISDATNVDPTQNTPANAAGNTTWIQYNASGTLAANGNLTWDGANLTTNVLKLTGSSSGFVGLQASATTSSPLIWTLPAGDGTAGQVMTTNGSGVLSFATVSGGGGGVTSYNGRQGAVTAQSSDITGALGYVPTNPAAPGTFSGALGLAAGGSLSLPAGVQPSNAIGFLGLPVSNRSGSYTTIGSDSGQDQLWTANGTGTLPANSSVAYPAGTIISFTTLSGTLSVKCTDTLTFAPSGLTGNRTVTAPGFLICRKVQSTNWLCYGLNVS